MTDQQQAPPTEVGPPPRPEDVDTGFWLWIVALPMMVIGYVVDLVTVPLEGPAVLVYGVSGVFMVVVSSVVLTFLLLMRQGYRWARTLLTGGGAATVVYGLTNLANRKAFDEEFERACAEAYAKVLPLENYVQGGGGDAGGQRR